jgi:hypothetical protein
VQWTPGDDSDEDDEREDARQVRWKYESDFAFGKAPASVVPAPDVRDADAGKSRG